MAGLALSGLPDLPKPDSPKLELGLWFWVRGWGLGLGVRVSANRDWTYLATPYFITVHKS